MVTVKVERVIDVPDKFIEEAIIDPAGYGIKYWAESAVLNNVKRTYTVTIIEPTRGISRAHRVISYDALATTLARIANGEFGYLGDWQDWANEALAELDDPRTRDYAGGTIDAELADAIVQYTIFGELVYG